MTDLAVWMVYLGGVGTGLGIASIVLLRRGK